MIFKISKTFTKLRLIYNQCSPHITFSEVMILHAMNEGCATVMELKEILLKDRSYIIRALSTLNKKGAIKEIIGSKPREYTIDELGFKALMLLQNIDNNLMIEKNLTVDQMVARIENHSIDKKYMEVYCD